MKTNLKIVNNCILVHFGSIWSFIWFYIHAKYFITYSLLFGIFSRICSAKFGKILVGMGPCNRLNTLSWLKGANKQQMIFFLFFFIIFHIWCSTKFFWDLPPRFFADCTSSMKITIRIPVADLSLDQACIYQLRAHHKIEYKAHNNTNS